MYYQFLLILSGFLLCILQIILLDGVFARPVGKPGSTLDGRPFHLTVRSNTRVHLLKDLNANKSTLLDNPTPYKTIREVMLATDTEHQEAIGGCFFNVVLVKKMHRMPIKAPLLFVYFQ